MEITYRTPSVKLLSEVPADVGFYAWLDSKKSVTECIGFEPSDGLTKGNFDLLSGEYVGGFDFKNPSHKVKVGNDIQSLDSYHSNIMKMNMQYNDLPYFVFEIEGSLLFRDLLYSLSTVGKWAVSLRLEHSVIDRLDPSNYKVSSEYKGLKEWEVAFEEYFELVKSEDKTDKNRILMPYSISARYWVGMNLRTLMSFTSMLRLKMPFFYQIYGIWMDHEVIKMGIDPKLNYVDSTLEKYFSKSTEDFEEKCIKVDDFYLLKTKMNLILYSQFIRQSDVQVRGLFDELVHVDSKEFQHKVFTGDTLLNVTYLAHEDRVKRTLSNRLCWFSQSDGDENDPHYWSKFINIMMEGASPKQVEELLPCGYKDGEVCNCKYKEDIKFRDQGLQSGYIPCSLLNQNVSYAEQRYKDCPNALNKAYLVITKSRTK